MNDLAELLVDIQTKLAKIEATGEATLTEAKRTNGRVTKLEDHHVDNRSKISVLENEIAHLTKNLDKIGPDIAESRSLVDKIKGNWQGVLLTATALGFFIDKLIQYWPKK
jgi:chromosome segregation ATPase